MLATTAIGAIWTTCSPDMGRQVVIERFGQVEPKVVLGVRSYLYNGKEHNISPLLNYLSTNIPSILHVILIPYCNNNNNNNNNNNDGKNDVINKSMTYEELLKLSSSSSNEIPFEFVSPQHPIYILYTSGTTGPPSSPSPPLPLPSSSLLFILFFYFIYF